MAPGANKRGRRRSRRPQSRQPSGPGKATEQTVKIVYWEEDGAFLGYLQDYPDYWTQGNDLEDLKEHLKDIYQDVTSGKVPGVRKVEDLVVS